MRLRQLLAFCLVLCACRPSKIDMSRPDSSELFRRKLECAKINAQVVKEWGLLPGPTDLTADVLLQVPVYGYSEALNTCVVATGSFTFYKAEAAKAGEAWSYSASLIDVLERRTITHCLFGWLAEGETDKGVSWAEFVAEFKRILDQEPPDWIASDPHTTLPAMAIAWQPFASTTTKPAREKRSKRK